MRLMNSVFLTNLTFLCVNRYFNSMYSFFFILFYFCFVFIEEVILKNNLIQEFTFLTDIFDEF